MFKKYVTNIAIGLAGGLVGAWVTLNYIGPEFIFSSNEFNAELKSQIASSLPSPTIELLDPWKDIVQEASSSSVAIQVFRNNRLIRQISGVVVSSDGLIIVPYDKIQDAQVMQVMTKNEILKAEMVHFDRVENLSIIKVSSQSLAPADISPAGDLVSGQSVVLVGSAVEANEVNIFSQTGLISQVSEQAVLVNTEKTDIIDGAKVVNSKKEMIGMTYVKSGKVFVAKNTILSYFLESYLNGKTQ